MFFGQILLHEVNDGAQWPDRVGTGIITLEAMRIMLQRSSGLVFDGPFSEKSFRKHSASTMGNIGCT